FSQFFLPYKAIGPVSSANQDTALSLELADGAARFGVYASAPRSLTVRLDCRGAVLYEKQVALDPTTVLRDHPALPAGCSPQDVTLRVLDGDTLLLAYTPLPAEKAPVPNPARPARPPAEIETVEELYLNGLHLEQYRHATDIPEPYYLEALQRDPGDARCNNAMGLLLYRRGKFAQAEVYFRAAIRRLTARNPNPYDGEPFYNLGLALKMQGRFAEAYDAFYKAVWNAAWQDAAYFELARLSSRKGQAGQALDELERSLSRNQRHHKARHLKIALLRRMGQTEAARRESALGLALDPLEYGALWEQYLLDGDPLFGQTVRPAAGTRVELALDYAHAGFFEEAIQLLEPVAVQDPLAAYTLGWVLAQSGAKQAARDAFRKAAALPGEFLFPNRLEDVRIFEAALRADPGDARAAYALGNFWYAHRRYDEAIAAWERSREIDGSFATVQRNLGLAYFNKRGDSQKALAAFEKAYALGPADARVFFELDQLYQQLNRSPEERLAHFEQHADLVDQRDDLAIERITLLNLLGRPEEAYQRLMGRSFHPWEGGEGKVTGQYRISLVEQAKAFLAQGNAYAAIDALQRARFYPPNLGEGKLVGTRENPILYYLGCAHENLGETGAAQEWFAQASLGQGELGSATYYNDQPPDLIYYQGLALAKLKQDDEARAVFRRLIEYGEEHLDDKVEIDYFAVSLPDFLVFDVDLSARNHRQCQYLTGLGYLGLGDRPAAEALFRSVLAGDANHMGATLHLRMV
ncbi:MAG TPA: tetratricopeptide repeat protein, partial [Anaerolineaceae bacterium]